MVDFFLLLLLAGAGDELQGIKRGVMEMANIVAINKADDGNIAASEIARNEAANALHYLPASPSGWTPRALACSARTGRGIHELWSGVLEYIELTKSNGWFAAARSHQARSWMNEIIEQGLKQLFDSHPVIRAKKQALESDVEHNRTTSFRAARTLLELYSDPGALHTP